MRTFLIDSFVVHDETQGKSFSQCIHGYTIKKNNSSTSKRFWNHNRYFSMCLFVYVLYICMFMCKCVSLFVIFFFRLITRSQTKVVYFLDIENGKKEIMKKMGEIALKSFLTHKSFVCYFFLSLLNIYILSQ